MIPIKNDKKLFVNINYNLIDNIINNNNNNQSYENENNILPNSTVTKKFVNFIEVPRRYQNIDDL
jgi:hypothetical protein